ncbi:hypothetical protein PWG14_20755 (plasmid) [Chromobacterium amazonense]|uniref:hypothetical protein n=1 Tax=Chromobacterium amazonense TaxID=1382803 RepID=UPI00237DB0F6|nr:hypothetical protein [Chromobacterium amazonense]MDE1714922.1 hypothetical protein [Chromobacterium amazonense]
MAKKSRHRRGNQTPKRAQPVREKPLQFSAAKRLWLWFGASGFLLAATATSFEYINGELQLSYSQPLGSAYELIISNTGPSDRIIQKFRVNPPLGQQVIYKVTQDIYANIENGKITLPDGPATYIPAAEFKELDGQIISAKSQIKFRLPPLSDRPWLEPEAALIKIEYSSMPKSEILRTIENIFYIFSIKQKSNTADFLVLQNYWTPVKSGVLKDAINQACREDSSVAKLEVCRARR